LRVLYDLIHARAAEQWHESINVDNFNRWAAHWLQTAMAIEEEFQQEGLYDTAEALDKIIAQQEKWKNVSIGE
jgi:hypothetical protein